MQKADIVIHQGDDSDFMGQTNKWYLPSGNYTGWKARYSVGVIAKDAQIQEEEDSEGNTVYCVELVLSATDTAALEPDLYTASLKLFDENGKCQTVISSTFIRILPLEVNNNGI